MKQRNDEPVLWTEGLPLVPAHFQQMERNHAAQLRARLDALGVSTWGLLAWELDRSELQRSVVRIRHCAAVLPLGTVIQFGEQDALAPAARPIDIAHDKNQMEIWIGVPRAREGICQVGERGHFIAEKRSVLDVHSTAGETTEIEVGRANLRILFGHEPREDFECIKLTELRRDSAGGFALEGTYIPPLLRLCASEVLLAHLQRILVLAESRRQALLGRRRERETGVIEADASDITRFSLLVVIAGALPVLQHLFRAKDLAPRELFVELVRLQGSLAAFASEAPWAVPSFDPLDLRQTFEPLFARLEALLLVTQRESCLQIDLQSRDDGLHFAQLNEHVLRCDRFLLGIQSAVPQRDVETHLPSLGKVASFHQISQVVGSALPGAHLAISHRPPAEIPVKSETTYFTVELTDAYFSAALQTGSLAVYLPEPFQPSSTRVQLFAIPPRAPQPA
jgi:type VI secretion system protein ImpJ